jgi:antitoxin PrlF
LVVKLAGKMDRYQVIDRFLVEAAMESQLEVSAEGQVTLRKEVLDHLGVAPGETILVDLLPCGRAEIRAARPAASIEGFIGCLEKPQGTALSIEDITEIAAHAWAARC